jgi:hypothetical protein
MDWGRIHKPNGNHVAICLTRLVFIFTLFNPYTVVPSYIFTRLDAGKIRRNILVLLIQYSQRRLSERFSGPWPWAAFWECFSFSKSLPKDIWKTHWIDFFNKYELFFKRKHSSTPFERSESAKLNTETDSNNHPFPTIGALFTTSPSHGLSTTGTNHNTSYGTEISKVRNAYILLGTEKYLSFIYALIVCNKFI